MNKRNYTSDLTFDEKIMMSIVRAAESFKRAQAMTFKEYGLSFPQYNILRVLDASDNGQNKISVVGKIMLAPVANMTGLAKRLEQRGFLNRKSDPKDERVKLLHITKKGKETLEKIETKKNESIDILLKEFSDKDKSELLMTIKKIIKATTSLQQEFKK